MSHKSGSDRKPGLIVQSIIQHKNISNKTFTEENWFELWNDLFIAHNENVLDWSDLGFTASWLKLELFEYFKIQSDLELKSSSSSVVGTRLLFDRNVLNLNKSDVQYLVDISNTLCACGLVNAKEAFNYLKKVIVFALPENEKDLIKTVTEHQYKNPYNFIIREMHIKLFND